MTENILYLEGVDPIDIYGVNNTKLERLKNYFSKIKIIARGTELKIVGEKNELERFERKFKLLIEHFSNYNEITDNDFERIILLDGEIYKGHTKNSEGVLLFGNNGKLIRARTPNQRKLIDDYEKNDLIFAVGPAGTGKTYTAIALAVQALKSRQVKKIILSRPAVEAGENLGFLPGDLKEKIDPYLQPMYDALNDMIPSKKLNDLMEDGIIEIAPLAFMRGRTLENAFVILDEAQNATINQLKMFLTRMGLNSKFIVTGDITQIDLPKKSLSGLLQAIKIMKNIKSISIVEFDERDIVRHTLVKKIVEAYEKNS